MSVEKRLTDLLPGGAVLLWECGVLECETGFYVAETKDCGVGVQVLYCFYAGVLCLSVFLSLAGGLDIGFWGPKAGLVARVGVVGWGSHSAVGPEVALGEEVAWHRVV